ncbi:MAG: nucleotidyltransferase domain-containing protein [Candidatus Heimdallarchaeota archaeon]|nr:nucleotidyltransferase domain-containing protein [Candidatus Heimdallarchaeota archaeon]
MEEENQEFTEILDDEHEFVQLPAAITDEEKSELFKELTTILSRRWTKEKIFVFGSSEIDLLLATRFDIDTLREVIEEYKRFVEILGLEVVEYTLDGETWYSLKSAFYAPSELQKSEFIVLGTIIGFLENQSAPLLTKHIQEKLINTNKMKAYQVDLCLRKLIQQGYIKKLRNIWSYNYRTLVEFGTEERRKISEEFRKI